MTAPHTRNVTRLFRQASAEDVSAGRDWYARASRLAAELAESLPTSHPHHGDVSRAAAVIAVLSPQLSWSSNVRAARDVYAAATAVHGHTYGTANDRTASVANAFRGLSANGAKAARLLTTNAPTDEIVSGPKVTAFWRTIADPTDPRGVVVDRHAVDVTVNQVTDDATRGRLLGRRGAYEVVSACYVRAARILSAELGEPITPAEVQAVTWTTWRRIAAPGPGRKGDQRKRTRQLSWSEVARKDAAGLCPASSPDYSEPHIPDGDTCAECGASLY
jgi:hypothetical protein